MKIADLFSRIVTSYRDFSIRRKQEVERVRNARSDLIKELESHGIHAWDNEYRPDLGPDSLDFAPQITEECLSVGVSTPWLLEDHLMTEGYVNFVNKTARQIASRYGLRSFSLDSDYSGFGVVSYVGFRLQPQPPLCRSGSCAIPLSAR
ncbi:MAG: hypothetical protein HYW26_04895 [Candidatus Aenigmarchaeota archaeon]|nr:hypothetical protein [Candidatus Aenigmarchaeota archaeon]